MSKVTTEVADDITGADNPTGGGSSGPDVQPSVPVSGGPWLIGHVDITAGHVRYFKATGKRGKYYGKAMIFGAGNLPRVDSSRIVALPEREVFLCGTDGYTLAAFPIREGTPSLGVLQLAASLPHLTIDALKLRTGDRLSVFVGLDAFSIQWRDKRGNVLGGESLIVEGTLPRPDMLLATDKPIDRSKRRIGRLSVEKLSDLLAALGAHAGGANPLVDFYSSDPFDKPTLLDVRSEKGGMFARGLIMPLTIPKDERVGGQS